MQKLDKTLIQETSLAIDINPAYIEKDYYIVELLKIIAGFQTDSFDVIFTGGTSLSKGFKIINRFSEDIDFMVLAKNEDSRSVYRNFRKELFGKIDQSDVLKVSADEMTIGNESRFFSFYVDYPKLFDDKSLRQQVKIEISAKAIRLPPKERTIASWVDEYLSNGNTVKINSLSPWETAANKFSAFLWRADCKDRTSEDRKKNDPTIVRHLYDLYKLQPVIAENEAAFYNLIQKIYDDDKNRGDKANALLLKEFAGAALSKIKADPIYEKEFSDFVTNMVYKDSDIINYSVALEYYSRLVHRMESIYADQ
ncbi:MAG: nucleotidyl transferase AbiEii/AbiGii toxin family protein [Treponema sp.]|nr:nucleotidyl transferase AbiEii/AbiGii toxin family protein [Treponema sp.]